MKKKVLFNFLDYLNLITIAGLFLFAGLIKLCDLPTFYQDISYYDLLPHAIIPIVGIYLVCFEIFVAIAIFIPCIRFSASICITCIVILFLVALSQALFRGINIKCGCFGDLTPEVFQSGLLLLSRDFFLLVMSLRLNYFLYHKYTYIK